MRPPPAATGMNHGVSSRFVVMFALAAAGLVAVVAGRNPAYAGLVAPFVVVLVLGVANQSWPEFAVTVRMDPPRAVEGDEVDVVVEVLATAGVPWLDLFVELPSALAPRDSCARAIVAVSAREAHAVRFPCTATRWGVASPRRLTITARDRFGFFVSSRIMSVNAPIRVYPTDAQTKAMLQPGQLTRGLGAHLSPDRADGCEFADVRPYRQGDRTRAVHWRVSARRGELWVSERHPERSADVVLVLDALAEVGSELEDTTLRRAVRAAMTLLEGHLGAHDRVGLYAVSGRAAWLRPRLGARQAYEVVDALLDAQENVSRLAGSIDGGPLRNMARGCQIIGLSSLLDDRYVSLLCDLAGCGHDVVVLESPPTAVLARPQAATEALARRLWIFEQQARRAELRFAGITTVVWDGQQPLHTLIRPASRRRVRR